jgi:hypothetical protein
MDLFQYRKDMLEKKELDKKPAKKREYKKKLVGVDAETQTETQLPPQYGTPRPMMIKLDL